MRTTGKSTLFAFSLLLLFSSMNAETVNITGTVVDTLGAPLAGVTVGIARHNLFVQTGTNGTFTLTGTTSVLKPRGLSLSQPPRIRGAKLSFSLEQSAPVAIGIFNVSGRRLFSKNIPEALPGEHSIDIMKTIQSGGNSILIMRLKVGEHESFWRMMLVDGVKGFVPLNVTSAGPAASSPLPKAAAVTKDTVSFSLNLFIPQQIKIDSLRVNMGTIIMRKEATGNQISIAMDLSSTQQSFGAVLLETALREINRKPVRVNITAATGNEEITVQRVDSAANPSIKNGGFQITNSGGKITVKAIDNTGAMYGMQEVGEQITINGLASVPSKSVNPRFPWRAIKFNLPWSTYRSGTVLSQHQATCKDIRFWESFLNMMAENRFSVLSLWMQHPYPYFIKARNFPLACSFTDAQMAEWKTLWTTLFQMAKDRGIETYLVTWNIFVSKGFKDGYPGSAQAGASIVDENTSGGNGVSNTFCDNYLKESITQTINEYPGLTGLGVTLGEGMNGMTPQERENWLSRTYIPGINAANRKIKFIHRAPMYSSSQAIEQGVINMINSIPTTYDNPASNIIHPIELEIKFNWSHGHSTPTLFKLHGGRPTGAYWTPIPTKYRMDWTVRNEDFFILRWGQPDFIRRHIEKNGQSYAGGYFIGSESYIPALDYFHVQNSPHINWKYAFERQWLFYKEWGRLEYDPTTPDKVFELSFDRRFGQGTGATMVRAYKLASDMPLRFACMIDFTWDFTLYSEGFGNTAFMTLAKLISTSVFDSNYYSITSFVSDSINNAVKSRKISPLKLADTLQKNGDDAMALVSGITGASPTLQCEIADVKAWCYLSTYFAKKLRAGVLLKYYSSKRIAADKTAAIALLQSAKTDWANLVAVTKPHQRAAYCNPTGGNFSWENYVTKIDEDITAAQAY